MDNIVMAVILIIFLLVLTYTVFEMIYATHRMNIIEKQIENIEGKIKGIIEKGSDL